ncbi:MAG TPA: oligosaccharide flippase family protein [Candidatus Eisenbacteria bacterium]|nr:oligosaccharide flippase family protein [Candidatus Eisenbacteria bacterium]
MRRLVRSTAILGLGSVAAVVAAIFRAKILAAWLGPEGTGLLAQLSSLTAVLVPLATLGVGSGLVTLIAEARARNDVERIRRVEAAGRTIAWGLGGGLALGAVIASPWLATAIYQDPSFAWAVALGAISVPFSAVASVRISMLQGHEAIRANAILSTTIAVVGIATIVPLAYFFGVRGAVAQLVVITAVWAWWAGRLLAPHTAPGPRPWGVDRGLWRPLLRFGIASLLVGLSSTLTLLVLRSILVGRLGLAQNGIYQVCVGVSGMVMPLILNAITATVWPEIAAKARDEDAAEPMRSAVRLGFLLTTALLSGLLIGAPVWVPLFYSGKFVPALDLLPIQFLGDYFRCAAWMFGIWLVPRNRLRPWVLFDLVYGASLLVAFLILVPRLGLKSVVVAYVIAHITHAVLHYWLARRRVNFRLGPANRRLLLGSFALLAGLVAWTPKTLPQMGLGVAAWIVWVLLVVRPHEWEGLLRRVRRLLPGGSPA